MMSAVVGYTGLRRLTDCRLSFGIREMPVYRGVGVGAIDGVGPAL
jgi:hypothetical protein